MPNSTAPFRLSTLLSLIAVAILLTTTQAFGQHEKFLHSFGSTGTDGTQPRAGLVMDASGNFYGTTSTGGTAGIGTVFEISPKTGGGWSYKVIHNFANNGVDGNYPNGSLIIDASGNLYGTTRQGGFQGLGMVFEMTQSSGVWAEKVLHGFRDSNDGLAPFNGLVMDASGNLYGTTLIGGSFSQGIAFEITHP
jgi:uncharacterized repeat protein (TIGR03803 family)